MLLAPTSFLTRCGIGIHRAALKQGGGTDALRGRLLLRGELGTMLLLEMCELVAPHYSLCLVAHLHVGAGEEVRRGVKVGIERCGALEFANRIFAPPGSSVELSKQSMVGCRGTGQRRRTFRELECLLHPVRAFIGARSVLRIEEASRFEFRRLAVRLCSLRVLSLLEETKT